MEWQTGEPSMQSIVTVEIHHYPWVAAAP